MVSTSAPAEGRRQFVRDLSPCGDLHDAGKHAESLALFKQAIALEQDPRRKVPEEYEEQRDNADEALFRVEVVEFTRLCELITPERVKKFGGEKLNELIESTDKEDNPGVRRQMLTECLAALKKEQVAIDIRTGDHAASVGDVAEAVKWYSVAARSEPKNSVVPVSFRKLVAGHPEYFLEQARVQLKSIPNLSDRAIIALTLAKIEAENGRKEESRKRIKDAVETLKAYSSDQKRFSAFWWSINELIRCGEINGAKECIAADLDRQDPEKIGQGLGENRGAHLRMFRIAMLAGLAAKVGDTKSEARADAMFQRCMRPYFLGGPKLDLRPVLPSLFEPQLQAIKLIVQGKYDDAIAIAARGKLRSTWLMLAVGAVVNDLPPAQVTQFRDAWKEWPARDTKWGLTENYIHEISRWYGSGKGLDTTLRKWTTHLNTSTPPQSRVRIASRSGLTWTSAAKSPKRSCGWKETDHRFLGFYILREIDDCVAGRDERIDNELSMFQSLDGESATWRAIRLIALVKLAQQNQKP